MSWSVTPQVEATTLGGQVHTWQPMLLVGADGLNSKVRNALDAHQPESGRCVLSRLERVHWAHVTALGEGPQAGRTPTYRQSLTWIIVRAVWLGGGTR